MKQLSTQKWILSSLLIAALGSQYYFSTSSKNIGSIDMASESTDLLPQALEVSRIIEKLAEPKSNLVVPNLVSAVDNQIAPIPDATLKTKTEGNSSTLPCNDCVILTKEEAAKIRRALLAIANPALKKEIAKTATCEDESGVEKMRCEREAREEKRREEKLTKDEKKNEAKLAKEEKKKEQQELRDEKFKDDFERMSSRCNSSDLECYSSALGSALNRYTSKDRRITSSVVNSVYNEHIAKELKEALKDPSNEKAHEALKNLMSEIPDEYKTLKTKSIDMAKAAAAPLAVEANAKFKQAEQLQKANKFAESSQVFTQAMSQKAELEGLLNNHHSAIAAGTESGDDKSTFNYYKLNYAKPASQWLANIMSSSSFSVDASTGVTINTNNNNNCRGIVRGGNSNCNSSNGSTTLGNNINIPTTNNGSIQFGTQQSGSRGSGRGSY